MPSKKKVIDAELQAFQAELLGSVRQMKSGKAARRTRVAVPEVVVARQASGLSQSQFATVLGISVRTLQKWEQGEREPSGAARTLIRIAQQHPKIIAAVLRG